MKTFLFLIASALVLTTSAQISKVSIQASGLTCSMCSNSINKALQALDFVEKVHPDVQNSTFDISFKPNSHIDFDKLKSKVEDAGFTVASFVADIQFNDVTVTKNQPVILDDKTFYFLQTDAQPLQGIQPVKIVDKGFVSTKENKKYAPSRIAGGKGVYNVVI